MYSRKQRRPARYSAYNGLIPTCATSNPRVHATPLPATMLVKKKLKFIPVTAESLCAPEKRKKKSPPGGGNVRDHLQVELRDDMGGDVSEYDLQAVAGGGVLTLSAERRSGDRDARLRYSTQGYADFVSEYRLKLVGWPPSVPFANFSAILGGIEPIRTLHTAWRKHILRFEPATDEDVANAQRDPLSVHPNPELIDQEVERMAIEEEGREEDADKGEHVADGRSGARRAGGSTIVEALVHHPGSFDIIGFHPTSTRPSIDLPDRPRAQRSDVKRPHGQDGEARPPKRPRDGVKSSEFVVELESGVGGVQTAEKWGDTPYWPTNEPLGEFKPVPAVMSVAYRTRTVETASASRSRAAVLDADVDDIESASGLSTREVSSEIEEPGSEW